MIRAGKGDGSINEPDAEKSAVETCCRSIHWGFDTLDRKFLMTIIERFDGGLSASTALRRDSARKRGTPGRRRAFLIQQGFVVRNIRGRIVPVPPPALPTSQAAEADDAQSAAWRGR